MSNNIRINLKDYYPELYPKDYFINVNPKVLEAFIEFQKAEWSYDRKIRYHKSFYSLDQNPYLENYSLDMNQSVDAMIDELSHKEMMDYLLHSISKLPEKESTRIIRYYFEDKSLLQIAEEDGVSITAIHLSIQIGLKKLKKILSKENYSLYD